METQQSRKTLWKNGFDLDLKIIDSQSGNVASL